MNIAFIYAKGRIDRYDKTKQENAATEFFYGALQMEQKGHQVSIYELGNRKSIKLWHKIAEKLYHWRILPSRTTGEILAELSEISSSLNRHDVIVATTTASAFGLATLKVFRVIRRPVVAIHCGIVNYQLPWWRRKVNAFALKHMWTQLFGEGELSQVINFYHVPDSRVEVNQFGVDTDFWTPGKQKDEYILAVGNDERRDYKLLLRVAEKIQDKVIIVTRRKITDYVPPNVEILKGSWHDEAISDKSLRELYRNASIVVIPLIDSPQPSGQSVCLQAMSCEKPTVLTLTKGLWSKSMMLDNENVLFVTPGDEDVLFETINKLLHDRNRRQDIGRNARRMVCEHGDIRGFSERLEQLCQNVLAQSN